MNTKYKQTRVPIGAQILLGVGLLLASGALGMAAFTHHTKQNLAKQPTVAQSDVSGTATVPIIDGETAKNLEIAAKVASVLQLTGNDDDLLICSADQVLYVHNQGMACAAAPGPNDASPTENPIQGPPGPQGKRGVQGPPGAQGLQGISGHGLPTAGLKGQVPIKLSGKDHDIGWTNLPEIPDTLTLTVNGQNGDVSLTSGDIDEGASNLYFTDQRAINALDSTLSGYLPLNGGTIGSYGTNTALTKLGNTVGDEFFVGTNGAMRIQRSTGGSETLRVQIKGDTQGRFLVNSSGVLSWGPGNATQDTKLYRGSASTLKTDGNIAVNGDIEIGTSNSGVILRSPNGTRWRIQVDNSGNLSATSL